MERRVSDYLRELPFLWVDVDDKLGPGGDRAYLERNAIALESNIQKITDRPPIEWVARHRQPEPGYSSVGTLERQLRPRVIRPGLSRPIHRGYRGD